MTFLEIKDEIHRRLRESNDSGIYFSTQDIADAANDGYMELSDATEWMEEFLDIELLTNRPYYDLHSIIGPVFLSIKPAFDTQRNRWLQPVTVQTLDGHDRRWERVVGTPQRIFTRGYRWLGLYPRTNTEGTDRIRQYYTRLPEPLCEDSDEPGFPEAFHLSIVDFALADLFAQDAETKLALASWQDYLAGEAALATWVNSRLQRPMLRVLGAMTEPR